MKWPGTNRLCNLQNYYYCLFFIVGIESNWCHLHAYFFYFSDLVAGSFPKEVIRCQKCSMLGRLLYRTACVPFLSNFLGMGPNQMNFQKYSKRPSTPPPLSFSENHIAIFYDRYGCIYAIIHLFWYPDLSLRLVWLLEPSSNCVLFRFFSKQLVKNITWTLKLSFCINFIIKKSSI